MARCLVLALCALSIAASSCGGGGALGADGAADVAQPQPEVAAEVGTGAAGADGGGGKAGTAGPAIDAGADTVPATGCGKDLSGTWDVIAQRPGATPHKAVMVISPETFSITVMNPQAMVPGTLTYTASGTKQVTFYVHEAATIAVQNTPAPLDAGSLPLALGGSWTFTGQRGSCTASVAAGLMSGRCMSPTDGTTGGGNWPPAVPPVRYGLTYTATRTESLPSHFGDLGGVWKASPDGDAKSCTIRVEGNKITAACTTRRFAGTSELTIGDDCVASGFNNDGYELSGRRR